ncbi:MAG: hypothetical protein GY711_30115 [bacterium]|nr:hypothetical protein [bacterium]
MNAVNSALTKLFDILLVPFEWLGAELSLILVSGVFGILALIVFKYISWQKGIKQTKDKIKGHMIEIRLYQDDLGIVSKAIGKVLLRNFQYLGLNFLPFVPLAIPFVFVVAQMVVRHGFEPAPVHEAPTELLAGTGTTLRIELTEEHRQDVARLAVVLPDGLTAVSPLVRVPSKGLAFQEVVPTRSGAFEISLSVDDSELSKKLFAGEERGRTMQPERVKSPLLAALWPAEDTLAGSPFQHVAFVYPESDLGWLPFSGPMGVILIFVIASMAFGFALLKPLGIQI